MSLLKQLWLSVFFVIFICLIGSFSLMISSTASYLQTQLYQKNVDGANNIALTISSAAFNPVIAEVQISSQFDTGFYQSIELTAPNGGTIIKKSNEAPVFAVPQWFVNLIPLEAPAGIADVSSGWIQVGKLHVISSSDFAYQELWKSSKRVAIYFFVVALVSGVLGLLLLRYLTRPLKSVVEQAHAISERRFVTLHEPATREFKQLVQSMNSLSVKVKSMLDQEAGHLRNKHSDSEKDFVTQVLNRDAILSHLRSRLGRDNADASGFVVLLRLHNVQDLNSQYSRDSIDNLLKEMGQYLIGLQKEFPHTLVGRTGGGDFLLLMPNQATYPLANQQFQTLVDIVTKHHVSQDVLLASSTNFLANEDVEIVLSRLEQGVTGHKNNAAGDVTHVPFSDEGLPNNLHDWNALFDNAIQHGKFQLNLFPVITVDNSLSHFECPIRLQLSDSQLLRAGQFLSWAKRAEKMPELDLCTASLALGWLEKQKSDIGINVSSQLLIDDEKQHDFINTLRSNGQYAQRLWLEIPETGVFSHLQEFKHFVQALKPTGCKIGIEHAGHQIQKFGLLHDLGLNFIKIDSSFIHDIQSNYPNQIYLQGLVSLVHSIGLQVYAEGVSTEAERQCVERLGFDGLTGPAIRMSES